MRSIRLALCYLSLLAIFGWYAKAQIFTAPNARAQIFIAPVSQALLASQTAYIAQKLGMSIVFDMATFHNGVYANLNNPYPINDFAPTTTDFVSNWVSNAQAAKAKYVRWVTKHQDNFLLWNSATSSYNVTQTSWALTGGGFDITANVCSAMQAAGINVVLSYQPVGTVLADVKTQLTELIAECGPTTAIWWDGTPINQYGSASPFASFSDLLSFVHGLQANLLFIGNNHPINSTFGFGSTDILEYEGPTYDVPNPNGLGVSEHIEGISFYPDPYWVYRTWLPNTLASAGTANTITIPGAISYEVGMNVNITAGTGAGQVNKINSLNNGIFTMQSNWSTIPDTTSLTTITPFLKTASQLQTKMSRENGLNANYLLAVTPNTSGHLPSDQATNLSAFGALH
jgi:hypothetical protein